MGRWLRGKIAKNFSEGEQGAGAPGKTAGRGAENRKPACLGGGAGYPEG